MKTTKEESVKAVKPSIKRTGRAAQELTAMPKDGVVKAKPDAAENLRDFLEDGLKDIYWAEKALTKALAKMAKNATSTQLIKAFEDHLKETEEHVTRLEQVFESLGLEAVAKKCDAMAGLLDETDKIIQETEVGNVRDAAMIAAAQKVEHYEIAAYGTLRVYAVTLGKTRTALLLAKTLAEEKNAEIKLKEIAVSHINVDAAHEGHK
ncbi:YciE/YciF ferroxidase family protein [Flavobacterium caseinilyticum]|uniref:Ferritin-like domain-containing protein n=1 Tax=Flavobacterium caseinilyticum TaxID=2541732 RepID=A0A4R5ASC4_9FLAO|nr:ferritin-like domain-containing protein [Flavobacterium caseinilyticum]TDD75185.1 ferritin-like domain-containing protein [Flavobacterium caseinilyticum]